VKRSGLQRPKTTTTGKTKIILIDPQPKRTLVAFGSGS
jgi:hypothetical protein